MFLSHSLPLVIGRALKQAILALPLRIRVHFSAMSIRPQPPGATGPGGVTPGRARVKGTRRGPQAVISGFLGWCLVLPSSVLATSRNALCYARSFLFLVAMASNLIAMASTW